MIVMAKGVSTESSYSSDYRQYESVAAMPSKAASVFDILTPSKTEKVRSAAYGLNHHFRVTESKWILTFPLFLQRNVFLCDFNQLRFLVHHQEKENTREALNNILDAWFNPEHIHVQFTEDIGTSYTVDYIHCQFKHNKADEHGNTLMHIATQTGNMRIATLLMHKGANLNDLNKQGQTPGHFAVAY